MLLSSRGTEARLIAPGWGLRFDQTMRAAWVIPGGLLFRNRRVAIFAMNVAIRAQSKSL